MRLLIALLLLASTAHANELLGNGHDGPLVVSQPLTVERGGVLVADVPAGGGELRAPGLRALSGDLLMVWRSTGIVAVDDAGVRVDQSDVGTMDFVRVLEVRGDVFTLREPLGRPALAGAQVVRVIEATTVEVLDGGSINAPAFDGQTGGVVAIFATGAFRNETVVSASFAGFHGGVPASMTGPRACDGTESAPPFASRMGRGVSSDSPETGRFARSSGGGGGVCVASGGGGGGHVGRGGKGGASRDGSRDVGGTGGLPLITTPGSRAFFGGGGGAGWTDWDVFAVSAGRAGGGLIVLRAGSFLGTGRYEANGQDASNYGGIDYGLGGAGAGGTVMLTSTGSLACGAVRANGGTGGGGNNFSGGTGGGGGGGLVILQGLRGSGDCPGEALAGRGGSSFVPGFPASTTDVRSLGKVAVVDRALGAPSPPDIEAPMNGADATPMLTITGTASDVEQVRLFVDRRSQLETSVVDGRFRFDVPSPTRPGVVTLEVAGLREGVEVSRSAIVHVVVRRPEAGGFVFSSTPNATATCGTPWAYDDDGAPTVESSDIVTFAVEPVAGALAPLRLAVDPITGVVTWTPTVYDQGTVAFDLVARTVDNETRQRVAVAVDCRASVGCGCSSGTPALAVLALLVWAVVRRR